MLFSNYRFLQSLNIPLSVETVCVFTAPIFSAFASWATYLLTKVPPLPWAFRSYFLAILYPSIVLYPPPPPQKKNTEGKGKD